MAKLSKKQIKEHEEAMALVNSTKELSYDEKIFILENFQESALHINSKNGAFFTPMGLARDMSIELPSGANVIDVCAGIGVLAFQALHLANAKTVTCVELNSDYIRVGKRVLPEATWIQADILDIDPSSFESQFNVAISNPPFGNIKTSSSKASKYSGSLFEYKTIEKAMELAPYGVFIIPQGSCGFEYSGKPFFKEVERARYKKFENETGLKFEMNCGLDTSIYNSDWKGVSPTCEIVVIDRNV